MKRLYLTFAIVGAVFPYYFLVPFVLQFGLDLKLLVELLFANNISTFFAVDFILSCIFFVILMFREANRLKLQKYAILCCIVLCTIGLSCAFPLFMYFRESHQDHMEQA